MPSTPSCPFTVRVRHVYTHARIRIAIAESATWVFFRVRGGSGGTHMRSVFIRSFSRLVHLKVNMFTAAFRTVVIPHQAHTSGKDARRSDPSTPTINNRLPLTGTRFRLQKNAANTPSSTVASPPPPYREQSYGIYLHDTCCELYTLYLHTRTTSVPIKNNNYNYVYTYDLRFCGPIFEARPKRIFTILLYIARSRV